VKKNQDTIKLAYHLSDEIATELAKVYITSSGDMYLEKMDAICAESQIKQAKEGKQRKKDKIMGIIDIFLSILEENNWGIFYKNKPIHSLDTNDGGTLYEVNAVDIDELSRVLSNKLEAIKEGNLNDWKTHTAPHSQQETISIQKKS
jgi:hypothetical protein